MSNRWSINKVGLLNFWYYDEEEFTFSDGKLLLRGSNGSGKSVTMQSFIPLLLDGNKSPERLDPFGSKARKLENYLLTEDNDEIEERTAYLYMEFMKESSSNYLTIGMGFKAQRGKSLKSWGFAITDGRRIGKDIFLYKDMGDKIPLSKKELEIRIGSGGMVKEGQGEYMKMVNDLLFGFDEIEEYDEMIKLLIQLRSPKLSKEFKPTVVYEILENSLQQLSEDDLRPMSEAIENMDNIKGRLEVLKESKKAAEKIQDIYDRYNRFLLHYKAKSYLNSSKEYDDILAEKRDIEERSNKAKKESEDASIKIEELKEQQRGTDEKKKELDVHDSLKIKEKIYDLEVKIEVGKKDKAQKDLQLDNKKIRERELDNKIKDYKSNVEYKKKDMMVLLEDMDELSIEFAFDEQDFMKAELEKNMNKSYDFSYINSSFKTHSDRLLKGKDGIQERDHQNIVYDNTLKALEKAKEDFSSKERHLNQVEKQLLETKEELIEKVYTWRNGAVELLMGDEVLIKISRQIQNFHENSSYDDVISGAREALNEKQNLLDKQMNTLSFRITQQEDERRRIKEALEEWRNKKEIEPERAEKVVNHRKLLMEKGIPFIPFYKAIDFKENLSEEVKGNLEEALLDMGLVDALIIPERYKNQALLMEPNMGDKYIFSSPNLFAHSLTEFFRFEKIESTEINPIDIDNALKSIFLDENSGSVYVNEKGEYAISILRGKSSSDYTPRFIGTTARARARNQQIELLTIELNNVVEGIQGLIAERNVINKRIEKLNEEFKGFPKDEDIRIAINYLKNAKYDLNKAQENIRERTNEEQRLYAKLKELNQIVLELTQKISLAPNFEVYKEAINSSNEYRGLLNKLITLNNKIVNDIEIANSSEEERENIVVDIENLNGDIYHLSKRVMEDENSRLVLKEQLGLSDYEEIESEIEECIRLLREIPKSLEFEYKREATEKASYHQSIRTIENLNEKISIKERVLQIQRKIFSQEFKLNYCDLNDLGDLYKNAQSVIREIKVQDKHDREYLSNQLAGKFTENNQYLREYVLRFDSIFDAEDDSIELMTAISKGKRLYITGKVRGKEIDFYELIDFIEEGIDENEGLLREGDRQLFEDILINTISKKIRAKIYHSQKWVDRMNELMENMNTSSGLSFSLGWTSKKAESEGQLDTKELVELLKLEGSLMKESDLNKLSEHFRSKIAEARRIQEDLGKNLSFHSIMREILDYRKWFEFKLFYRKTGQNKRELTNNAFYQFSGGEKAMAMYVPLFSAVFARYEGARKDCLRLISLDEAFAGVDEKNIRDMFRLLNDLNLDYMINSQILWGDYDTVPSLAISELIRPDNADFITVIRYYWNGRVKELVV